MSRVWSWLIAVFAVLAVGLPAGGAVAAERPATAVVAGPMSRERAADRIVVGAWAPTADQELTVDPGVGAKHRRGRPVRRVQQFVVVSGGDVDPNSGGPESSPTPADRLAAGLAHLADAPPGAPRSRQPSAPTVATAVTWLRARGPAHASDDDAPRLAC